MAEDLEEIESKHRVVDLDLLVERLAGLGFQGGPSAVHVDEYYDTGDRRLERDDFVARIRLAGHKVIAGFKGPRRHHVDGTYRRIEIEFPAAGLAEVQQALAAQGLGCTWRLQKRRREFRADGEPLIALDELPGLGHFVELEGRPTRIAHVYGMLGDSIGPPESRNYYELALAWLREADLERLAPLGLGFDDVR